MASIKIGLIGLGRMGLAIAHRLQQANIDVICFDTQSTLITTTQQLGLTCAQTIQEVAQIARIIWIMVPAGKPVDDVINQLSNHLQPNDIIIDGGNSFYKDSIRRANELSKKDIIFFDCGTSGGLHGKENGFSLMVGGNTAYFTNIQKILEAIATPFGYALVGPSGAGHFVKMVHNGIEYALLQAYGEGFHLLKEGPFKNLDLEQISAVWNHGSIIRSWILELTHTIFKQDQNFEHISGNVGENLTGRWTVEEAHEYKVPVKLIQDALDIRAQSRESGGNYGTKLVALLRYQFGGHPLKKS